MKHRNISCLMTLLVAGSVLLPPANTAAPPKDPFTPQDREYWAFQQVKRPKIPQVQDAKWVRNPIDAFMLSRLEAKDLSPAPPADKITLLRRATYDLTGLPATPEEADAFLADRSPNAFEKVVDRLLASPHYGERWGRHWLDVARYADSSGFEHNWDRPTAWRYRDYVVESFNNDTPYNVFIAEQLAGDELDSVSFNTKTATGFLRAGPRVEFRDKDIPSTALTTTSTT